jgi:hypothetical protein
MFPSSNLCDLGGSAVGKSFVHNFLQHFNPIFPRNLSLLGFLTLLRLDFRLLIPPIDNNVPTAGLLPIRDKVLIGEIRLNSFEFICDISISDEVLDKELVFHNVFVYQIVKVLHVLLEGFVQDCLSLVKILDGLVLLLIHYLLREVP